MENSFKLNLNQKCLHEGVVVVVYEAKQWFGCIIIILNCTDDIIVQFTSSFSPPLRCLLQ